MKLKLSLCLQSTALPLSYTGTRGVYSKLVWGRKGGNVKKMRKCSDQMKSCCRRQKIIATDNISFMQINKMRKNIACGGGQ